MTANKVNVSYEISGTKTGTLEFQWAGSEVGRDICLEVITEVMAKEKPDETYIGNPIVDLPHGQRPAPRLTNHELMMKHAITKLTYEINGIAYPIID